MTPQEEMDMRADAAHAESDLQMAYDEIDYALSYGNGIDAGRKLHLSGLCDRIKRRLMNG